MTTANTHTHTHTFTHTHAHTHARTHTRTHSHTHSHTHTRTHTHTPQPLTLRICTPRERRVEDCGVGTSEGCRRMQFSAHSARLHTPFYRRTKRNATQREMTPDTGALEGTGVCVSPQRNCHLRICSHKHKHTRLWPCTGSHRGHSAWTYARASCVHSRAPAPGATTAARARVMASARRLLAMQWRDCSVSRLACGAGPLQRATACTSHLSALRRGSACSRVWCGRKRKGARVGERGWRERERERGVCVSVSLRLSVCVLGKQSVCGTCQHAKTMCFQLPPPLPHLHVWQRC